MKRLLVLASLDLAACLSVPEGPKPECQTTADCDGANGEVCDEGVCWGNPPNGPFAAVITAPSERKNDLVSRELYIDSIAADGTITDLQLEEPITYSGMLVARCATECPKAAPEATIIVTRPSADFFHNGPGYRQVVSVEPATGQFSIALPASRPEVPYTITVVPAGRDDEPPNETTLAQIVPPLRTELRVMDVDPAQPFDLTLGAVTPTIDGVVKDRFGFGLGSYRVVALGRWDANAPLTEISTIDYTTSDGTFHLRLSEGLLPDSIVEIVAKPYGPELRPSLHASLVASTGAITGRTLTAPDTGNQVLVPIDVKGANTGGEIAGIIGARVSVTGIIPAQPGGTITTFTAEGTTDENGHVELDLLDGSALASTYRVSVVPPPNANVGIVFDQPFENTGELMLPERVALVGKVLDAGGNPLADVQVTVKPSLRFEWSLDTIPQAFVTEIPAATATTPDTGEFVVYVDPLLDSVFGSYDLLFEPTVTANAPAFTQYDVQLPRDTSQSSVPLADIYLPDASHVRGVITSPNGTPIEGAELRIFSLFDATAAESLCMAVPHAPPSCPIPARLLGHGSADDAGMARLTLPR